MHLSVFDAFFNLSIYVYRILEKIVLSTVCYKHCMTVVHTLEKLTHHFVPNFPIL